MKRKFTSADIVELVGILRESGAVGPSEIAGMEMLGSLLKHLETVSDNDIDAEVRRYFGTA